MLRLVVRPLNVLLALLSLIATQLIAQSAPTPAPGIHGRVTHAVSGAAIASATIDVTNAATGSVVGRVITSADGTFHLPLAPGQYRVSVRALGFQPRTRLLRGPGRAERGPRSAVRDGSRQIHERILTTHAPIAIDSPGRPNPPSEDSEP